LRLDALGGRNDAYVAISPARAIILYAKFHGLR
jgi:hypothetical protein